MMTMTTLAAGDASRIVEPRRVIVRDAVEWRALWAAHAGPATESPAVDFSTRMVAAVFAGEQPSPGFEIEMTGARQWGDGLEVIVEQRSPAPGMMAAALVVTPFHIVSLPRHNGDVEFTTDVRPARGRTAADGRHAAHVEPASRTGAPGTPHRRSRSSHSRGHDRVASSTGLRPHVASALAYLAGPFSGILVLLAEHTSRHVRFHAWQSILALGGVGVLAVGFLLSAFAALLVSPSAFTFMYWMAFLTAIAWVLLWAVCLFQAFKGRRWKLPLVGNLAERRAAQPSLATDPEVRTSGHETEVK